METISVHVWNSDAFSHPAFVAELGNPGIDPTFLSWKSMPPTPLTHYIILILY